MESALLQRDSHGAVGSSIMNRGSTEPNGYEQGQVLERHL